MKKTLSMLLLALLTLGMVISCDSSSVEKLFQKEDNPSSLETYTVTFDLNGISGTTPPAQTVEKEGKANKPADPIDTIHIFASWYKTKDQITGELSDEWNFDNDEVTENITLYAKWTRTISDIIGTVDFPYSLSLTSVPDNAWINTSDPDKKTFKWMSNLVFKTGSQDFSPRIETPTTKIDDSYVYSNDSGKYTIIFKMTNGVLTSIEVKALDEAEENVRNAVGTYAPASTIKTVEDVLATVEGFPISNSSMSAPDNAWTAVNGNKCYRYNNDLCFLPVTFGLKSIGLGNNVEKSGNDYIYSYEDTLTVTFQMTGDVLTSITFTNESSIFDGTYTPASN